MRVEKLVIPTRRGVVEGGKDSLLGYDKTQMEKIRARDRINMLEQMKELDKIDKDLTNIVRRIKSRKYIDLIYRIAILKVHLKKFSNSVVNKLKTKKLMNNLRKNNNNNYTGILDFSKNSKDGGVDTGRKELDYSILFSGKNNTPMRKLSLPIVNDEDKLNFVGGGVF
ncbi:hypothetical protein FG379_002259 [Cryptosporidium bovis]|uniref:uncharacterized protein n=1 Tax=Cryptosporidium bovis TaxID=310047 RepID=UPI003519FE61|nr:hypothetical protein FG379_002259 [Cryptosporidium bovis]